MPLHEDNTEDNSLAGRPDPLIVNEVHLVGHMSKPLEIKEMPSGDWLGKWALVIKRPRTDDPADETGGEEPAAGGPAGNRRRQSHDTIDCISFDMGLIERLSDVAPRTRLDVHGALRRRFYPGQDGRQSSYAVEAFTVVVLSTPEPVDSATAVEAAMPVDRVPPVESVDLAEWTESLTTAG
jgi:single-strand DNA-binding protein